MCFLQYRSNATFLLPYFSILFHINQDATFTTYLHSLKSILGLCMWVLCVHVAFGWRWISVCLVILSVCSAVWCAVSSGLSLELFPCHSVSSYGSHHSCRGIFHVWIEGCYSHSLCTDIITLLTWMILLPKVLPSPTRRNWALLCKLAITH